MKPNGFSWVEPPLLAGMARPESAAELEWLRSQGISLLVSLTEEPLPRSWVNDAGLLAMHIPIEDMHPPSPSQIEVAMSALAKAREQEMPVAVHCTAGYGRTGTILACWFVYEGMASQAAISRMRDLRPGSIETDEQESAILDYARRRK